MVNLSKVPENIILFGGSFDPLHYGHLVVARAAYDHISGAAKTSPSGNSNNTKLIFLPAYVSPFKAKSKVSFQERVEIIKSALVLEKTSREFSLDTLEGDTGTLANDSDISTQAGEAHTTSRKAKPSYSFLTVQHYKKNFPNCELYWLLGEDSFRHLNKWKNYAYLAKNLTFIVYSRSGENSAVPINQANSSFDLNFRRVENKEVSKLIKQKNTLTNTNDAAFEKISTKDLKYILLKNAPINISSSELRESFKSASDHSSVILAELPETTKKLIYKYYGDS